MKYPQLINALNLDVNAYRAALTETKQTTVLIQNLRDNYFSYSDVLAKKELDERENDSSFHTVYRVRPIIKVNSDYKKDWDIFTRAAFGFLDCEKNKDIINELVNLKEKLIKEAEKLVSNTAEPLDRALKTILDDFENEAGFAECITIKEEDGVLTAEHFFKIIAGGHPFNDEGASPQHGPLTHRLQCYLLGQYIKNNIQIFFPNDDDFQQLRLCLAKSYPSLTENGLLPVHKIISVFYRMLGQVEFQNSFDWEQFNAEVQEKSKKLNPHKEFRASLNSPYIWTQVFDRFGYAGYFSVPSNFGFIQALGCFPFLPQLGIPAVTPNQALFDKHLKTILDLTPKFLKIEPAKQQLDYNTKAGILFFSQQANSYAIAKPLDTNLCSSSAI